MTDHPGSAAAVQGCGEPGSNAAAGGPASELSSASACE
jgi:hypothetical protein